MLTSEWFRLVLLMGVLLCALVALRQVGDRMHPETSRKVMHVVLGLAMLSCPLLFTSIWPVAVLAAATIGVLAVVRWLPMTKDLGDVVGGVERQGGGEYYFPLSAFLLLAITRGHPILFGVPILTLTLADAVAALIGVRFGRNRYATSEGSKSIEGSTAFFIVAFLTTYLPLTLYGGVGRAEAALIGLIFGLIVMMLEAISIFGTDNIFIPLGGYLLLRSFLDESVLSLALVASVLLLLFTAVLFLRSRRTLTETAVLSAVLVLFTIWVVGGWRWLVPPFLLLVLYSVVWPRRQMAREPSHDGSVVLSVAAAGLIWLSLAVIMEQPALYHPFVVCFAAHLCFFGIRWFRVVRPRMRWLGAAWRSVGAGMVMFLISELPITLGDRATILVIAAAPVCLLAGAAAFTVVIPVGIDDYPAPFPWARQAALSFATSLLSLIAVLPTARA